MKITTKFMLAMAFVGSLVLTSCKDYDEDNYANQLATSATVAKKLADDIAALRQKLADMKSCECNHGEGCQCKEKLDNLQHYVDSVIGDTTQWLDEEKTMKRGVLLVRVDQIIDRLNNFEIDGEKTGKTIENVVSEIMAKAEKDSTTFAKADSVFEKQIELLTDTLKNYATVEQLQNAVDSINTKVLKPQIDSLWAAVDSLANVTDSLQNQIDSLKDARQKLITGVLIQQVYSSNIGSFNSSLLGVNTNMLVAYYGKAASSGSFPSAFESADETYNYKAGQLFFNEGEGNLGKLYLTINPVDEDFDKLAEGSLQLVNSQDVESGVKLGEAKKSDKVLQMGYTRAANNGFYEVPATLEKSVVEQVANGSRNDLSLGFDAAKVAKSLKGFVESGNVDEIKAGIVNIAGNLYSAVSNVGLDALGVKTSWTDSLGEHSVSSEYKMAACAVKPLAFTAVDERFPASSLPMYKNAVKLIDKIIDKATNKILEMYPEDYVDGKLAKLEERRIKSIDYKGNNYSETGEIKVTVEYRVKKSQEFKEVTFIVDEDELETFLPYVAMTDYESLINNVVKIVEEANEHYKDYVVDGGVKDMIHDYLDQLNQTGLKIYNAIPELFKPKLIIRAGNRYTACGIQGVATKVFSGDITIYPITYTDGLLVPVYKKYVKIDDQPGKIYDGNDPEGRVIKVGTMSKGKHTVEYSALDFHGNEIGNVYEFWVE